jgi:toxin FitB
MIVLDTNVLSALMRTEPESAVVRWLDQQPSDSIWITSITVFEARFGLAVLPSGRRRQALEAAFSRVLEDDLEGRVLEFDVAAARWPRRWPPNARRPGGPLTCITRRSPASPWRAVPRWPLETSVTSRT